MGEDEGPAQARRFQLIREEDRDAGAGVDDVEKVVHRVPRNDTLQAVEVVVEVKPVKLCVLNDYGITEGHFHHKLGYLTVSCV